MATLAFSIAGQFAGGLVGGPIGATIGRALGALAGSAVDAALFGEKPQPAAGADIRLQGSSEGGPIPRVYGWSRVTGNIIWATELEEISTESAGAKGMFDSEPDETQVVASFAVALCEGLVRRLGRIWADGQLLETEGLTIRFYRGSETQLPDSLIEAKQGAEATPAYRGLCYLVFERLPLAKFGNRIPNLSVELCRVVGELEPAIRAVTVIPGSTEYGYDPVPRVRIVGPGATETENAHISRHLSDWDLSLDELQALCPNLERVALVVAWFGDDVRCGSCEIRPKVENSTRVIDSANWVVSGVNRGAAQVVSTYAGGPAYGGTPSDAAVLAAIADLNARGIAVTLYPIVLMDVPHGNALTNPYAGTAGQPPYPWRGRITCSPAPGEVGTPNKTAAAATQVNAFVGAASAGDFSAGSGTVNYSGPADWGFRRMVLHYAKLAQMAGGVDAFLIGSEMRGLSTVRAASNAFPFVTALVTLAADVRGIVGGATKLTYAADWSEYSGYQPPDVAGEKFFHLDPLWASANIDAVGIDNYMPLADWRDGAGHADATLFDTTYDVEYLRGNVAGGEGFDWHYPSTGARNAGNRTAFTDSGYGEPWVWRYKDLVGWWSHAHHNRPGGVRSGSPTGWMSESKPIWFTELGCGAVDKGANQPNVFGDPKSSEDARPYFSTGASDPLIQRQFLRAQLGYWSVPANNPASTEYSGRMLDTERIYLWTWDARPYPAFPAEGGVWADGPNHRNGHWLTGRLGAVASDELIAAIAGDYGIEVGPVDVVPPLVHGLQIEGVVPVRDAASPVLAATGLTVRDSAGELLFGRAKPRLTEAIDAGERVAEDRPLTARRRPDPSEVVGRLALSFLDRERDYLIGTVTALRDADGAMAGQSTSLVLDTPGARFAAERLLIDASSAGETMELTLPHSYAALEVGDVLDVDGAEGRFEVTEIRDGEARRIVARTLASPASVTISSGRPRKKTPRPGVRALPLVVTMHLPALPASPLQSRLLIAAWANPWPGQVTLTNPATGATLVRLSRSASIGELVDPFSAGPVHVWDVVNEITVKLYSGHLASGDDDAVLAGSNRLAIENDAGDWEVLSFAEAELVSPGVYRLARLLRGLEGTDHAAGDASAGNRVVVLDDRVATRPLPGAWVGEGVNLRAYAGPDDLTGTIVAVEAGVGPVLSLAPVWLMAQRGAGTSDIVFNWTRRSRADGSGWGPGDAPLEHMPEAYRLTVFNGPTAVRTISTSTPSTSYSTAHQTADFGTPPAAFTFTVAQVSPVYGPGHAGHGVFNG